MTRHSQTDRRILIILVTLLAAGACAREAPEDAESHAVVPVTTTVAARGTIAELVHASGIVTPAPGAELIVVAPEAARVAEIPKAEGDMVRRGDLLVRFEIPSTTAESAKQRAEITRAEARLTNARAAQARARDLFDRGVAARKEVEDADKEIADAEADLAGARAAAGAAEAIAARSVVRATFDGIVVKRSHNPGDLVEAAASDPVLRVVDPRRLEVAAAVPLDAAPRVTPGAAARIVNSAPGAPGAMLKVVSHPGAVQPGTATVPVRLAFSSPSNYPVGTPVQVEITVGTHRDVVVVPATAIAREGEETSVFVVTDNVAHRRPVMVGIDDGRRVEITMGLNAGETVVESGQNGLPDGAKVAPTAAKAAEP
jgi:cobalt-zinc-cadmium efflux system membrane fusion protein